MNRPTRRAFLCSSTAATASIAGGSILSKAEPLRSTPAHEDLSVAVIGSGPGGRRYMRAFAGRHGCHVEAVCSAGTGGLAKGLRHVDKVQGYSPRVVGNPFELIEDSRIRVVAIASPVSSRSKLVRAAVAAGKDVFVQPPISLKSHEIDELRFLIENKGVVVESDAPYRSMSGLRQAVKFLRSGKLGQVRLAQCICKEPSADRSVLTDGSFAARVIDLALWGLGIQTSPVSITTAAEQTRSMNNRVGTFLAVFGYDGVSLQLEVSTRSDEHQFGVKNGVVFHCDQGRLVCVGNDDAVAFSRTDEILRVFKGSGDHVKSFVKAVRGTSHDSAQALLPSQLLALARQCHLAGKVTEKGDTPFASVADRSAMERLFSSGQSIVVGRS